MSDTQETIDDIIAEMLGARTEFPFVYLIGEPDTPEVVDFETKEIIEPRRINIRRVTVEELAYRIKAAHRREAQSIERIVRDAIISYTEQYVNAPNDETEREIQHRAEVANEWLRQHGFAEEPTNWSKEEIPCL